MKAESSHGNNKKKLYKISEFTSINYIYIKHIDILVGRYYLKISITVKKPLFLNKVSNYLMSRNDSRYPGLKS